MPEKTEKPEKNLQKPETVLRWIEQYISENGLTEGDSLPREMDIARTCSASRSSVREALTALRVLGIIRSRRKGGITIVKKPVLLEISTYLTGHYTQKKVFDDALEFRALLEWGSAELIFSNCTKQDIRDLRKILKSAAQQEREFDTPETAEKKFHTRMTRISGNRLAGLLSHVYESVFDTWKHDRQGTGSIQEEMEVWISLHEPIVDALERKDSESFRAAFREHTFSYMRFAGRSQYTKE